MQTSRPRAYFIRRISVASNAIQTVENEMCQLIKVTLHEKMLKLPILSFLSNFTN